jgi:adenine-specific DNA methylase
MQRQRQRIGVHNSRDALERLHTALTRLADAELNDYQALTGKYRAAVQQWGTVATALMLAEKFGLQSFDAYPGKDRYEWRQQ